MDLGKVAQLNTEDRVLNQVQGNIVQKLNQLLSLPILNGNQVSGIQVDNSIPNPVNHGLGRPVMGYILTRSATPMVIADSTTPSVDPNNIINLDVSSSGAVSIYFF